MPQCGSQAILCGLPIRFDTYSGCSHMCKYCFTQRKIDLNNIGKGESAISLKNFIDGKRNEETNWCDWNIPIHFGGLSDPFQPCEEKYRYSYECLKVFAETYYPFVVSTKGALAATPKYFDILAQCNCVAQISAACSKYDILEKGASTFIERLKIVETLSKRVRRVNIRIQPYMTEVFSDILKNIKSFASAGAYGITVEGMKFAKKKPGLVKVGGDFAYPLDILEMQFKQLKDEAHKCGLKFYSGENRLRSLGDGIMEAILGTLSGENNKLLMCGNPTKTSGTFYDSHTSDRAIYRCHTVSSLDSPRTSKDNIQSLIRKYGEDSNFARVRIYGDFPIAEDDVFIPLPLVEHSVQLGRDYAIPDYPTLIHIACDVARFGDDQTVIGDKINEKVEFYSKTHGQDTMKTADKIIELGEMLKARYKWTGKIPVKVDDGGVGGGVVDRLRQLKRNNPDKLSWLEIFPVTFGKRINNRYYHDSTSYMMGVVKRLLTSTDEAGAEKPVELILPNDDNLIAQLSTRKYRLTDTSKIQVESKEAMKKRGLASPDEADCLLLLCLPVRIK